MSSTPDTATTPTAADQPATDGATTASDRLWAALHARPGATAEQLSGDAGIGRSTATKILARWVTDGTVERAPSPEGRKSASRFTIASPTAETGPVTPRDDGPAASAPHAPSNEDAPGSDRTTATTTTATIDAAIAGDHDLDDTAGIRDTEPTPTAEGNGNLTGASTQPDATTPGATPDTVPGSPDDRVNDPDPAEADDGPVPAGAEAHLADASGTGDDVGAGPDSRADTTGPAAPTKRPRLAPGALHGMVEDYLRDHAGQEFGPTKIGHDLGRSPGAISNALERLTTAGYATRTKDRPKKYTLATTDTTHLTNRAEPDKR